MYDQLINFKQNTGEGKMATMAAKICFLPYTFRSFESVTQPSFELLCTHTFPGSPALCRTIASGHCRVQQIRGEDGSIRDRRVWKLGMWLAKQRRLMRRGMLEEDKIALLKGMGISSNSAQGSNKAAAGVDMNTTAERAISKLGATDESGGKGVGDAKQQERDEEEKQQQEGAGFGVRVCGSATAAGIGRGKICKRGEGGGRKKGTSVAFGVLWERWLDLLREFSALPSLPSAVRRCNLSHEPCALCRESEHSVNLMMHPHSSSSIPPKFFRNAKLHGSRQHRCASLLRCAATHLMPQSIS